MGTGSEGGCGRVDECVRWALAVREGVGEWMRGSDGYCGSEGGLGELM